MPISFSFHVCRYRLTTYVMVTHMEERRVKFPGAACTKPRGGAQCSKLFETRQSYVKGGFRGQGGICPHPKMPNIVQHTLKQHNSAVQCSESAINGIKLCLSFSHGLKFQVVYFQKCSSFWGTPSPDPLPGRRPWTHC